VGEKTKADRLAIWLTLFFFLFFLFVNAVVHSTAPKPVYGPVFLFLEQNFFLYLCLFTQKKKRCAILDFIVFYFLAKTKKKTQKKSNERRRRCSSCSFTFTFSACFDRLNPISFSEF